MLELHRVEEDLRLVVALSVVVAQHGGGRGVDEVTLVFGHLQRGALRTERQTGITCDVVRCGDGWECSLRGRGG